MHPTPNTLISINYWFRAGGKEVEARTQGNTNTQHRNYE